MVGIGTLICLPACLRGAALLLRSRVMLAPFVVVGTVSLAAEATGFEELGNLRELLAIEEGTLAPNPKLVLFVPGQKMTGL